MRTWSSRLLLAVLLVTAALGGYLRPVGAADVTVKMIQHPTLGPILADAEGMVLYLFTMDTNGESVCYGECEEKWPPLVVGAGQTPTAAPGLTGKLGITIRRDGKRQVTYDGMPLYYWWEDVNPGDATGHGVGGVWFVVDPKPATVMVSQHATLGPILTDINGRTLYRFARDLKDTSTCYGPCEQKWPPLLVAEGKMPIAPEGLPGRLGTTTRADGKVQVTYNGWPLYYWFNDKQPGDATGHLVNQVWFAAEAANPTVALAQHTAYAEYLVGPNGMTLYVFAKDGAGVSNCTGACLEKWPPLLLEGGAKLVPPVGLKGVLGTMTREDGRTQVTYNGMPLYYWFNDKQAGDTTGHLVNKVWFVAVHGFFGDTFTHWASADVAAAVRGGWVSGYPDGSFKPDGTVTRAEFIKMLVDAFALKGAATQGSFGDTAGHWSEAAVEAAVAGGIIHPADYAGARFEPDRAITREEIALFAARAAGLKAGSESLLVPFADSAKVSASARALVAAAVEAKIVTGYPDGTLRPDGSATRGEAVVMILRALKAGK